jgi:hypothetical protein
MIFLILIGPHLNRLTQMETAVRAVRMMIVWKPILLRSSNSGSAAHDKKVTTSLAICDAVAGVPFFDTKTVSEIEVEYLTETGRRLTVLILYQAIEQLLRHGNTDTL